MSDDDLKQFIIDFIGWNQKDCEDRLTSRMARHGIHSQFVTAHIVKGWLVIVYNVHMPGFIGINKAEQEFATIAKVCRMGIPYRKLARTGRGGTIEGEVAFQIPVPKGSDLIHNLHAMSEIYGYQNQRGSVHRDR